jgi:hypothetical protein
MDLRDFIAETIVQIVEGVKDAQLRAREHGARVNPHLSTSADLAVKHGILIASGAAAQLVQFDVALAAKEGTGTKEGGLVSSGLLFSEVEASRTRRPLPQVESNFASLLFCQLNQEANLSFQKDERISVGAWPVSGVGS